MSEVATRRPRHSKNHMTPTSIKRAWLGALGFVILCLVLVPASGCSGGHTPMTGPSVAGSPPAGSVAPSPHAIHLFAVQPDGSKKRLDFSQASEVSFSASKSAANEAKASASPSSPAKPFPRFPLLSATGPSLLPQSVASTGQLKLQDAPSPVIKQPTVDNPDPNDAGFPFDAGYDSTAWALVVRAAAQCYAEQFVTPAVNEPFIDRVSLPPWLTAADGTDDLDHWFVYSALGSFCDGRMLQEQNLLCIADRLAAIGDAVGTTVWPALSPNAASFFSGNPPYDQSTQSFPLECTANVGSPYIYDGGTAPSYCNPTAYAEWDIPPQADADRFIVRDLAIHVLGLIPTLDAIPIAGATCPSAHGYSCACSELFADVINGSLSLTPDDHLVSVFGEPQTGSLPAFPPASVPLFTTNSDNTIAQDNSVQLATTASQVEAQVLRAGGRLLHDLVRRDVYSDLASSAKQSAQVLDPNLGNEIAWNASGSATASPYGTLAHAARVLTGRWELGLDQNSLRGHGDLACDGVPALNVLKGAYGADYSARVADVPLQTPGEARAANLVENAGIIFPACEIENLQGPGLKAALIAQLTLQEQQRDGVTSTSAPSLAAVFTNVVNGLADSEVITGFSHALRIYRILTGSPDVPGCNPVDTGPAGIGIAGLVALDPAASPSLVSTQVSSNEGVVFAGGVTTSRLSVDPIARAGGMLQVGACNTYTGAATDGSPGTGWDFVPETANATSTSLPPSVFQDPFSMAQAYERRLVFLEAGLGAATGPAPSTGAGATAAGAVAELRSWADQGLVTYGARDAGTMIVETFGIPYAALGIPPALQGAMSTDEDAAIEKAIGFVWGPPWVAECAAHTSQSCPANFDAEWIEHPSLGSDNPHIDLTGPSDPTLTTTYGLQAPAFAFTFPMADANVPHFLPTRTTDPSTAPHLYMVLLHDPSSPGGQGKVLGVIRLPWTSSAPPQLDQSSQSTFPIAPMQRELLHDALDVGKWIGAAPPRLGDPSSAQPAGYCVDGVPRDVFVPLQNELTSTTGTSFEDSWQHYLDIAKQAATTADALGQQLLNDDLQISERDEAAGEALADLCGDVGALSQTTVDSSGNVNASGSDTTLNECFNEPSVDVVSLATIPSSAITPDLQTWLGGILHCTTANDPLRDPLCDTQKQRPLTFGSLNIKPFQQQAPPPPPLAPATPTECLDLGVYAQNRGSTSGFQATQFRTALNASIFGTSALQGVATALAMNVDTSDNWTVTYHGNAIMDSHPGSTLFPGCLGGAQPSCGTFLDQPLNYTLLEAFRYCPSLPTTSSQLFTEGLGSSVCDSSAPSSGTPAMAELNMIKWRVEGALWMIGASGGEIPAGMFNMPIPVDMQPSTPGQRQPLFIGAAYNGQLGPASNGQGYTLTPQQGQVTTAESLAFGHAVDMPLAWQSFSSYAANEIPQWYLGSFTPPAPITPKLVQASNTALTWSCQAGDPVDRASNFALAANGFANPPPYLFDTCNSSTKTANLSLANAIDLGAWTLDGLRCTAPFGEPVGGAPGSGPKATLVEVINAMKTDFDATPFDGYCAATGGYSFWPAWSEWSAAASHAPLWHPCGPEFEFPSSGPVGLFSLGFPSPPGQESSSAEDPMPAKRVNVFANMSGMNGTCQGIQSLVGAAVLSCVAQTHLPPQATPAPLLNSPPGVTSMADVPSLESWLSQMSQVLNLGLQQLFVENVPQRVIDDFQMGTVGAGNKGGAHGQDVLDFEEALYGVPGAWSSIGSDLSRVSAAVQSTSLAVTAANLAADSAMNAAAIQSMQIQGQLAQAEDAIWTNVLGTLGTTAACVAGAVAPNPLLAACLELPSSLGALTSTVGSSSDEQQTGTSELEALNQQTQLLQSENDTAVAQALVGLNESTTPLWSDLQTQIDNIRTDVLKMQSAAADLQLTSSKAAYQAAIGTGADLVTVAGQEVPIPVNTVLNRQSSATAIRYQAALTNAKALAYMARRAIEQRLGTPLSAITQPVGPLDAPASWADDICSLTGINYNALSTPTAADAGGQGSAADTAAIAQFADSFVGDYVDKLSNFVQYFNVQYPSHQGDDTAVLSLRSDLLDPIPQCSATAPNLLVNSGNLDDILSSGQVATATQGWQLAPCTPGAASCLSVITGGALAPPLDGPGAGLDTWNPSSTVNSSLEGSTGISWLVDLPQSGPGGADAGSGDAGTGTSSDAGVVSLPPGLVTQAVTLAAGNYVLSWWDQARDSSGNLLTGTPASQYIVRVYDGGFNQVAQFSDFPFAVTQDGAVSLWSSRRTLGFSVADPGTYYVSFGASTADEAPGSVAIADVQLETPKSGGGPSPYMQTSDNRMVEAYGCPPSDSDLRSAFVHSCDSSGSCYYDLTTPIVIDTDSLNSGTSRLAGKLAKGNFNFRHVNLAVNLVGTGVHDCTNDPSASCFGSGYIEYTLEHDATAAGILDWNGNSRFFDFGIADIQHGKALAAERYITMPLGSEDQMLVSQAGIQHVEFAGRPLDGAYHLRIYDSPDLQWQQLQDVQIILNYEYWSEIVANGITQGN